MILKTPLTYAKETNTKASSQRTCVLVLGMHRSGTSMIAGILGRLGCVTAKNLMPENFANERGYFESLPIAQLNDRVLQSAGSAWDDWQAVNPGWFTSAIMEEFQDQAETTLDEEFDKSRLFVLKDPRICRILPFWRQVLDAKGINPVVMFIHRNPIEVSASLQKRDGTHADYCQLLWLRNTLEAELNSRDLPRYFTSFSAVMSNWGAVTKEAADTLGLSWPRMSSRVIGEVQNFMSPDLKHFNESAAKLENSPFSSGWVKDLFNILERWVEKGEDARDYAKIDEIRTQFDYSVPVFSGLLDSREDTIEALTVAKSDLGTAQDQVASLTDNLKQKESEVAQRRAEADYWSSRVSDLEKTTEVLRLKHIYHQTTMEQKVSRLNAAAAQEKDARRAAVSQISEQKIEERKRQVEMQAKLSKRDDQINVLQTKLQKERKDVEARLYEKEEIFASRSWKITAPLRWMSSMRASILVLITKKAKVKKV